MIMKRCLKFKMNSELRRLQEFQLEKLKEFKKVCDENNIKFFIIGGTFLGAVRHKGFIPWDDDIDIAMPRDDYNKLIELSKEKLLFKNGMKVDNFKIEPKMRCYFSRLIVDEEERKKNKFNKNSELGLVIIDILPLDGTPNNIIKRKCYYLRTFYYRTLAAISNLEVKSIQESRKKFEKIILKIGKRLKLFKFINRIKCYEKLDKIYSRYKWNTSEFSGTITGAYKTREIVPTKYFGNGKLYDFEDIKLMGPEMYDEYLTHMYGDYMQLPPEDKRKSHFDVEFKE